MWQEAYKNAYIYLNSNFTIEQLQLESSSASTRQGIMSTNLNDNFGCSRYIPEWNSKQMHTRQTLRECGWALVKKNTASRIFKGKVKFRNPVSAVSLQRHTDNLFNILYSKYIIILVT